MIRIVWGPSDVTHARFGYSRLVELTESLWLLQSGRAAAQHGWWLGAAAGAVAPADRPLLAALVPVRPAMADFLFGTADRSSASLTAQLDWITVQPVDVLVAQMSEVWAEGLPTVLLRLFDGPRPATAIAETLWRYWEATLEEHWPRIRNMLEEDIAYRAARLASDGLDSMLVELHERVRFEQLTMSLGFPSEDDSTVELDGQGMLLLPSVFAWPLLAFTNRAHPKLVYGARGIGRLTEPAPPRGRSALSGLLGKTRTQVLLACQLPVTTTELSLQLSQSPATVSQHLSILRECGLLRSWRNGRRVLYLRSPLGDSIVAAQPESADENAQG